MRIIAAALLLFSALPAFAQDLKGDLVKHLKTSRDFTLKVAEAMPADSYSFKLTPPQMSFGGGGLEAHGTKAFTCRRLNWVGYEIRGCRYGNY